jgi:hypothetical protein
MLCADRAETLTFAIDVGSKDGKEHETDAVDKERKARIDIAKIDNPAGPSVRVPRGQHLSELGRPCASSGLTRNDRPDGHRRIQSHRIIFSKDCLNVEPYDRLTVNTACIPENMLDPLSWAMPCSGNE